MKNILFLAILLLPSLQVMASTEAVESACFWDDEANQEACQRGEEILRFQKDQNINNQQIQK